MILMVYNLLLNRHVTFSCEFVFNVEDKNIVDKLFKLEESHLALCICKSILSCLSAIQKC